MNQFDRSRPLVDVRKKDQGMVVGLPDDAVLRSQCIRLGLSVGSPFFCIQRLPGGTIVVETGRQEIALGRALASQILVSLMSDARSHDA